jgi:hypothetical protein
MIVASATVDSKTQVTFSISQLLVIYVAVNFIRCSSSTPSATFCNASVNFIIRQDKKNVFLFAALQSESGTAGRLFRLEKRRVYVPMKQARGRFLD